MSAARLALATLVAGCSASAGSNGGAGGTGTPTNGGPPPVVAATGEVIVEMTGFRSDDGMALLGLYTSADGFPSDGAKAHQRVEVTIAEGRATARFAEAPAQRIAIGVLHDEDGDKKMKTGTFGIPKEGYGVSRDAAARFGPPSFGDAAFDVAANQPTTITIKMRY